MNAWAKQLIVDKDGHSVNSKKVLINDTVFERPLEWIPRITHALHFPGVFFPN